MKRRTPGAALIEALVAITTLTIAGIGMMSFVMQTVESVRLVSVRGRETQAAAGELLVAQLWTPAELAVRVGRTRVRCCDLVVQPLGATLYRVALADTSTGAVILETWIYARALTH